MGIDLREKLLVSDVESILDHLNPNRRKVAVTNSMHSEGAEEAAVDTVVQEKTELEEWFDSIDSEDKFAVEAEVLRFLFLLKERTKLDQENQKKEEEKAAYRFSTEALQQQLYVFLETLKYTYNINVDKLEPILLASVRKKDEKLTSAGLGMTIAYSLFVAANMVSIALYLAIGIGGTSYGGGNIFAELSISSAWNLWDTKGQLTQANAQATHKELINSYFNRVGITAMLGSIAYAGAEMGKSAGNLNAIPYEAVAGFLGGGFAIANFCSAAVEFNTAQKCLLRREEIFDEILELLPKGDPENDKDIIKLKKEMNKIWVQKKDILKLSNLCFKLQKKLIMLQKENKIDVNVVNYSSTLVDQMLVETGRYNKHAKLGLELSFCGAIMAVGALFSWGFIGATHGAGLTVITPLIGVFSAISRLKIESNVNALDLTQEAIKEKNKRLLAYRKEITNDVAAPANGESVVQQSNSDVEAKEGEAGPLIDDKDAQSNLDYKTIQKRAMEAKLNTSNLYWGLNKIGFYHLPSPMHLAKNLAKKTISYLSPKDVREEAVRTKSK